MSDGLRTALYVLSAAMGAFGVLLLLLAFVQSRLKTRVRETTPFRVLALGILVVSAAATVGVIAWVWPHPPQ
ncbi:hypothetical protein [Cryptosporangium aurantiacum]|uniref:Uncharacterized protein n=1 Tax=Cryptosporangium aurantiacum TaxID=134849 RepID=A0A1M7QDY9_9ACTN|nr:hypothetical protein [Cryptosporangium aurantiacum]SHN29084.1 hypothetical protein SAMN05443668_104532 [Cryptosporangium aurantiacum]